MLKCESLIYMFFQQYNMNIKKKKINKNKKKEEEEEERKKKKKKKKFHVYGESREQVKIIDQCSNLL